MDMEKSGKIYFGHKALSIDLCISFRRGPDPRSSFCMHEPRFTITRNYLILLNNLKGLSL
jgi:hypothetical protein